MNSNKLFTIGSAGLFAVFAMMVLPAQVDDLTPEVKFYGAAHLIKLDEAGSPVFAQTIHNQLVDTGETFLLQQTFQDGTTNADDVQIGSICVSDAGSPTVAETETAADFDGDNGVTENNCKEDTTVTIASQTAQIGALTFAAGGTNVADGDTITAIGICQNDTTDDADFNDCATEGILFAVVDTSDVTLNTGETVQITYTFDITSAST